MNKWSRKNKQASTAAVVVHTTTTAAAPAPATTATVPTIPSLERLLVKDNKALTYQRLPLFSGFAPALFEAAPAGETLLNYTGSRIPSAMWQEILSFLIWTYNTWKGESQVRLFYNDATGDWKTLVAPQKISRGLSTNELTSHPDRERVYAELETAGYFCFGTVHHHCSIGAFMSGTDENDERKQNGLHITVGYLDRKVLDLHARLSFRNVLYPVDWTQWFDDPLNVLKQAPENLVFPEAWKSRMIESDSTPAITGRRGRNGQWATSWYGAGSHGVPQGAVECSACGGSGFDDSGFGYYTECAVCQGDGWVIPFGAHAHRQAQARRSTYSMPSGIPASNEDRLKEMLRIYNRMDDSEFDLFCAWNDLLQKDEVATSGAEHALAFPDDPTASAYSSEAVLKNVLDAVASVSNEYYAYTTSKSRMSFETFIDLVVAGLYSTAAMSVVTDESGRKNGSFQNTANFVEPMVKFMRLAHALGLKSNDEITAALETKNPAPSETNTTPPPALPTPEPKDVEEQGSSKKVPTVALGWYALGPAGMTDTLVTGRITKILSSGIAVEEDLSKSRNEFARFIHFNRIMIIDPNNPIELPDSVEDSTREVGETPVEFEKAQAGDSIQFMRHGEEISGRVLLVDHATGSVGVSVPGDEVTYMVTKEATLTITRKPASKQTA